MLQLHLKFKNVQQLLVSHHGKSLKKMDHVLLAQNTQDLQKITNVLVIFAVDMNSFTNGVIAFLAKKDGNMIGQEGNVRTKERKVLMFLPN